MIEQFPENLPNRKITENSSSKSGEYELSENGVPLVLNKEGQKVESGLYKKLNDLAPEKATEMYKALKSLEVGEFKNSKLKDENGELRIVWHGSPRKFDEFKTDAKGTWRYMNEGVHFSSSREIIEQYSEKAQLALDAIRLDLTEEVSGIKDYSKLSNEHFTNGDKIYNEIIADLVENGEESRFYKKWFTKMGDSYERRHHLDAITYGKKGFGIEWAFEIFNGEMPSKENAYFDERANLWLGKDIGKYAYACVLNIERPLELETNDNMDHGFRTGEDMHKEKLVDGTILHHTEAISAMGGIMVEEAKNTCSIAVFDPNQIKIIGVESTGGRKGPKTFHASEGLI